MMNTQLEEVIVEFHEFGIPETRERELKVPIDLDTAVAIVGLRRVGKTYLLYTTMKKLIQQGLPLRRLFYINFEDERLAGLDVKDLSGIVELYYKLNPDADRMYLFLDEVQEVTGWEKFVRRLIERKNARIFVTGSSSRLLSREIATSLRGRSLSFHLFPLSFREFLSFKGLEYSTPLTEPRRGRIKGLLEEYVQYGGFPGIVDLAELIKIRTLQEYLDLIVYRDLVERYGIEKTGAMKALIRVIVRNFARKLSVRKLNGLVTSMGVKISRPTTSEYLSYLEDVGFVIPVRKYHPSEVESLRSAPKLYIADTGFASVFGVGDRGYRIENIVAIELLRRKRYYDPRLEIRYWDDGRGEVDFVVLKGFNVVELIQVSYEVEDSTTMDRELRALLRASKSLGCKNLTVVTWDYEDTLQTNEGKIIRFVPLWKWLLGRTPL